MDLFIKAYPYRLFMGLVFAGIVWWTNRVAMTTNGEFPFYYYVVIVVAFLLHQVL